MTLVPVGLPKGSKKELTPREKELIQFVAKRIKQLRIEKGYTSYENFAFDTGIPRMIVYRMEKGETDFNFSTLIKVLEALETDISSFFEIKS